MGGDERWYFSVTRGRSTGYAEARVSRLYDTAAEAEQALKTQLRDGERSGNPWDTGGVRATSLDIETGVAQDAEVVR